MKYIFTLVSIFVLVFVNKANAQSLSEIFQNNSNLKSLLVNPVGLEQDIDSLDANGLEQELNEKKVLFKMFDTGAYGKIYVFPKNEITIGGVDIADTYIVLGDNYSGIMYVSQPSDLFEDACAYIGNQMKEFSLSDANETYESNDISVYAVSDNYGVGIIGDPQKKVAIIALMDIKNLNSFLQMATLNEN